ncbi:MAG: metallophosphoesterase, partial [Gemmataceae bacterium]
MASDAPQIHTQAWWARIALGLAVLLLGGVALLALFVPVEVARVVLAAVLAATGLLQVLQTYTGSDRRRENAGYFGAGMSLLAGAMLFAMPKLIFAALAIMLGLSWLSDGIVRMGTALRERGQPDWIWNLLDGLINALLGLCIAIQWPFSGAWSLGLFIALRNLSTGWAMILNRRPVAEEALAESDNSHPDGRLGLPEHEEIGRLRSLLAAEQAIRLRTDRYWAWMFVLTFFAIHVGRMDAEWNFVGLLSPAVAVVGDVMFSLLLAYGLIAPLRSLWRFLSRPVERRLWGRYLQDVDAGEPASLAFRGSRWWLTGRMRYALHARNARGSPTAALGWGLQVGLPLTAILIAINPIWGISWYFNTENWVAGAWEMWAEQRTDDWRMEMVKATRALTPDVSDADFFRVEPPGVEGATDFSFIVIGDTGEGDPSQHILRDQLLLVGAQPDVKFLVVSSDVIYPAGAMRDYEPKFYLPFKGFHKPIYAVPGNHDWYDALESFVANFYEPRAARAALRARRAADHGLTTTTEARIEAMIAEAAYLRAAYGIQAGQQQAPYFEVQARDFALIVVDTGILRQIDPDQERWLRAALERAAGKFKMVILGHPLFAAGHYQGAHDAVFDKLHQLMLDYQVNIVMGGDTHDFEYYRETYEQAGRSRRLHHFVNGGGGAYLSIGTALDWPDRPAVPACAHYPRADQLTAKLDRETPAWKQPIWWWIKYVNAWPSSAESVASVFDYNRAPFYQSFMEIRVEGSKNQVRLLLYGCNGRLRWRDLHHQGQIIPDGQSEDDFVEFVVPMS